MTTTVLFQVYPGAVQKQTAVYEAANNRNA